MPGLNPSKPIIARVAYNASAPVSTKLDRIRQRLFRAATQIQGRVLVISTCGGFFRFPWPEDGALSGNSKNPSKSDWAALTQAAEYHLWELLNPELLGELKTVSNYLTIGADSYSNNEKICELVAIVDLKRENVKWTGKFYPRGPHQMRNLYRNTNLGSHFLTFGKHKVLVLGCHDLNIFSPRGEAKQKEGEWRYNTRKEFYALVEEHQPSIVLHHPHQTDSHHIWKTSIGKLKKISKSFKVDHFASGINYHNGGDEPRGNYQSVLKATKFGSVIDIVV